MKKVNLLMCVSALGLVSMFSACSTNDTDCHECHIAWMNASQEEVEVEIGEFCGNALEEVESNGYTLSEDVILGSDTILAGSYAASDIHCEEHADH